MIELLGIGVRTGDGQWRIRRITARLEAGMLMAIMVEDRHACDAVLDAVTGRLVPDEGRIWISGLPLMRQTRRAVQVRVGDVDAGRSLPASRSALDTALSHRRRGWLRLLPTSRAASRAPVSRALDAVGLLPRAQVTLGELSRVERILVQCASALAVPLTALVLRNVPTELTAAEAHRLLSALRATARARGLTVLVALPGAAMATGIADRVFSLSARGLVDVSPRRDYLLPIAR